MMEEKEIDLLDLLADVLSHWRGVLVWMIIGALVFGAVDYMMSVNVIKEVEGKRALLEIKEREYNQLVKLLELTRENEASSLTERFVILMCFVI